MNRQNNETFFSFGPVSPKIYEDCVEITHSHGVTYSQTYHVAAIGQIQC